MTRRSHPDVYRVENDDDADAYNAPTKLAPTAAAQARQLLVERLPPSHPVPRVYDATVDEGDPETPNGTMIMVNAPGRAPAAPRWGSQPEFRIHVQVTAPPPPVQARRKSRKGSWIDRLPTAFLVAVIVGSLVVGAAGVAMFLYYC